MVAMELRSRTRMTTTTEVLLWIGMSAVLLQSSADCVPMKYEIGFRNSIDLDAEQTEARYDQGLLSDIMNDEDQGEVQKAESCTVDNYRYDHGQKVQRSDPCEICLCIDGEIFCWWKQCDSVPARPELSASRLLSPDVTISGGISASHHPPSTTSLFQPIQPQLSLAAGNSQSPWFRTTAALTSSGPVLVPSTSSPSTRTTSDESGPSLAMVVSSSSTPAAAAVAAFQEQPDAGQVRVLHSPNQPTRSQNPVENIPQNILTFPQSPPIMMYRPVSALAPAVKNGTIFGEDSTAAGRKRGSGKKAKFQDPGTAKKPYRKPNSGSKGFVLNYDRFGGVSGFSGSRSSNMGGGQRSTERSLFAAVTERSGGVTNKMDSMEEGEDESDEGESDEEDIVEEQHKQQKGDVIDEVAAKLPDKVVGTDSEFGGFGFGMIKEVEEDKQQHYIITSSGHVEMFDDGSMETTENAFGINQFSQRQQQPLQHEVPISFASTTLNPLAADDGKALPAKGGQPIPPMITLTTNVTQNSNYSYRTGGTDSGSDSGLALSSGSVIDVLNSTAMSAMTVDSGSGGDYLDDNQTELIYPAVPGLSDHLGSNSRSSDPSSSSRRGTGSDRQVMHPSSASRTTVAGNSNSEDSGGTSLPEQHCVVMGVSYAVGAVLKQETGNCLHCVCVAGPENDPQPRVTCTPLNCPPLILPDILDGAGF
ncbi:uncharacterized protein LOC129752380 [Uranotaenia lowii]|uniref:uncharacterized protein LOC129752380 n=1 Tax=Uranotaenia lowii TaxID=190385 RepID=UPI0024798B9A|nr:uncharacterized protein LOC129752380 [Uranotaenia lowii]XP_055604144.1 uncharacterized protein LOC129752380 [Uranotaenia lowii]XP_055604145.1 uncharacterized protein LOC129752380 [Uranotaenia lowii]XP_055604146.1 uncharacterized protein LOC129752380 [Uranotaenia lowii]